MEELLGGGRYLSVERLLSEGRVKGVGDLDGKDESAPDLVAWL